MAEGNNRRRQAEEELQVAKRYFYGGFALLPWLWGVSVLFYRHRALLTRSGDAAGRRGPDVQRSSIALVVSTAAILLWFTIFQLFWKDWGSAGRSLLVVDVTEYW